MSFVGLHRLAVDEDAIRLCGLKKWFDRIYMIGAVGKGERQILLLFLVS
jgi:hypothetical protein